MLKNNVSKLMGERRLNMKQLAELGGVHRHTVSDLYHNTAKMIALETIEKLCRALKCNVGDIFDFEE